MINTSVDNSLTPQSPQNDKDSQSATNIQAQLQALSDQQIYAIQTCQSLGGVYEQSQLESTFICTMNFDTARTLFGHNHVISLGCVDQTAPNP